MTELWLLAGQSNMEGVGDLADAPHPHPDVRVFTMARRWEPAREPLHFLRESPDFVHHQGRPLGGEEARRAKEKAVKGVGPGLWFGRFRAEQTGRSVDLIAAAHGGTSMAQWLPQAEANLGSSLYGSMLESVRQVGRPLTGVLWYQGCNDTNPADSKLYPSRMQQLVASLRRDLGQPSLPWVVAQIGRVVGRTDDQDSWDAVREAQRRLPQTIEGLEVVSTVDLELDDWIHVSARAHQKLARRFAVAAKRLIDADRTVLAAPQPLSARWDTSDPGGTAIRVEFVHVTGDWTNASLPHGFSLIDGAGRDLHAVCRTRVEGSSVLLRTTTDELGGATVAYAKGCNPAATLVDEAGQGLLAFTGLVIDGLPPVTGWFRSWDLCSIADPGSLEALSVPPPSAPGWHPRKLEGWWYLILSDLWHLGAVAGQTDFFCSEPMELELRVGNDVPFRLFLDGQEVLKETTTERLTSSNIDFEYHRWWFLASAGTHRVTFLARGHNEGMGLDLRLARTDATTPLPIPR